MWQEKLTAADLTVARPEFSARCVEDQMKRVSSGVERSGRLRGCGHSLASGGAGTVFAEMLRGFMLGRTDAGAGVTVTCRVESGSIAPDR